MKLCDYIKPLPHDEREALAERAGTSWLHMRNVAFSGKSCGFLLAVALERETAGAVRRWDLRPDDWHLIWPELIDTSGAPPVPASRAAAAA